tara:strand:- start:5 stop:1015 length:1011 start_codon:yes stop_codon:yes gene_type:complete
MKKSTNLIYYPAGCYGTFFEYLYCLDQFDSNFSPFTVTGSSHGYKGNHFSPAEQLIEYVNSSSETYQIGRVHPSLFEEVDSRKNIKNNDYFDLVFRDLEYLENHFNKIVVIHPTLHTKLWMESNVLDKCLLSVRDFNRVYKKYGYTQSYFKGSFETDANTRLRIILSIELDTETVKQWGRKSFDDLEIWEMRELMSIYWDNRYKKSNLLACWDKLTQVFKQVKFISLDDIKSDPLTTVSQYLDFVGINSINKGQLNTIINKWMSVQRNKNKDTDVRNVVNAIINNKFIDWEDKNFNLLEESYIQNELRNHNIEIKCFNLNVFPSNSQEIAPFLVKL